MNAIDHFKHDSMLDSFASKLLIHFNWGFYTTKKVAIFLIDLIGARVAELIKLIELRKLPSIAIINNNTFDSYIIHFIKREINSLVS